MTSCATKKGHEYYMSGISSLEQQTSGYGVIDTAHFLKKYVFEKRTDSTKEEQNKIVYFAKNDWLEDLLSDSLEESHPPKSNPIITDSTTTFQSTKDSSRELITDVSKQVDTVSIEKINITSHKDSSIQTSIHSVYDTIKYDTTVYNNKQIINITQTIDSTITTHSQYNPKQNDTAQIIQQDSIKNKSVNNQVNLNTETITDSIETKHLIIKDSMLSIENNKINTVAPIIIKTEKTDSLYFIELKKLQTEIAEIKELIKRNTEIKNRIDTVEKVVQIEKSKIETVTFYFPIGSQKPTNLIVDIAKIKSIIGTNENYLIQLSGYTDASGSASFNLKISEQRVNLIRQELINSGIDPQKIFTQSFGEQYANGETSPQHRKVECNVVLK